MILSRRRYMGKSDVIVTDINGVEYKVVKYIATPSSGTLPIINTGFKATQDTYLEMKCANGNAATTVYNGNFLYGAETPRFSLRCMGNEQRFDYNTSMVYGNFRFSGGLEVLIVHDKNTLYIDGVQIAQTTYPTTGFTTPYTVFLCGLHRNSTQTYISPNFIIKYCKIKDNGVLIRDYIPVSRLSDGKYGFFDKANLICYFSVNNGEFLGG
mgnify:CR=1 FL=1